MSNSMSTSDVFAELVAEVNRTAESQARLYRAMEALEQTALEIKGQRDSLLAACREAEAGLEFAVARSCACKGGFVCAPHLALAFVQMALVKAGP